MTPSDADRLLQLLDTAERAGDGTGLAAARVLALGDALGVPAARVTDLVGQLQESGLVDARWGGEVRVSEAGRTHLRDSGGAGAGGRVINAVFQGPATGVNFGDGARQTFATGDNSPVQGGDNASLQQTVSQQWGARVAELAVALANLRAAVPGLPPAAQAAAAELDPAVRDVIAAAERPGASTAAAPHPAEPQVHAGPLAGATAAPAADRSTLSRAIERVTEICGRLGTMGENVSKLAPYLSPILAAVGHLHLLAGL